MPQHPTGAAPAPRREMATGANAGRMTDRAITRRKGGACDGCSPCARYLVGWFIKCVVVACKKGGIPWRRLALEDCCVRK